MYSYQPALLSHHPSCILIWLLRVRCEWMQLVNDLKGNSL